MYDRTGPRESSSRRWQVALLLAGGAWSIVLLLLIVRVVRVEVDRSGALRGGSMALFLVVAVAAIGSSVFALQSLRRHRAVERDLRQTQRTFQGILTIAVDAIVSVEEEQRVVHYNHGAEAIFGWPAAEIIGQPLDVLLPPRFRAAHGRHVREFGAGTEVARRMGERRQIYGLRRDGSEFPAEASISKLEVEGARRYNVVMRDITGRLRAEQHQRFLSNATNEVNASLDYEATLIAAVHAPVPYLCDCAVLDLLEPGGEVRRHTSVHDDPGPNRVLRQLAGPAAAVDDALFPSRSAMTSGEVLPRALGTSSNEVHRALGARATITVPMRARDRMAGALTLISTDPSRAFDDDAVTLARDLADRLMAAIDNATLYRDERRASQMRDELLGIVSHDLRNPLSAISMCARVLAEHEPDTTERRRELAVAILDSAGGMQRLIQDLLDAATIQSGHLRITSEHGSIEPVIHRAISMVMETAADRGVVLVADIAPGLPVIALDALRMEQVIANLLANAVKFTERDGRVRVAAAPTERGVRVTVEDTGIGIPEEALPHIFDRFWHARRSSRTAGTGLGLAIAKGIVVAHGGVLEVKSTLGAGSSFSFEVPRVN